MKINQQETLQFTKQLYSYIDFIHTWDLLLTNNKSIVVGFILKHKTKDVWLEWKNHNDNSYLVISTSKGMELRTYNTHGFFDVTQFQKAISFAEIIEVR